MTLELDVTLQPGGCSRPGRTPASAGALPCAVAVASVRADLGVLKRMGRVYQKANGPPINASMRTRLTIGRREKTPLSGVRRSSPNLPGPTFWTSLTMGQRSGPWLASVSHMGAQRVSVEPPPVQAWKVSGRSGLASASARVTPVASRSAA